MSFNQWKQSELGLIPLEWEIKCIDEVAEVIGGGTPSTKREEYYGGAIPWITPKDLSGFSSKYISNGERFITDEGLRNSNAKLLPKHSVLFSCRAPIGYIGIAKNELTTNQGIKGLICINSLVDYEFMYYKLRQLTENLESIAGGSTFKEISTNSLRQFKIALPPLEEQRLIKNILSNIDSKIELNKLINKNLLEIEEAIFKHWFIDYELPNEFRKHYKTDEVDLKQSELGMIPIDWSVMSIGEVGQVVSGGTPSTKIPEYYEGNISWITPKDLSNYKEKFIKKGKRSISELGLIKSSAKLMKKNTVLFTSRAPIGYIVIADNEVCTNQGFKSIICNEEYVVPNYLYNVLKYQKHKICSIANGSTFQEISKTSMENYKIIVPSLAIQNHFNKIINKNDRMMKKNLRENELLESIRDLLLKNLLKGKIRVTVKNNNKL